MMGLIVAGIGLSGTSHVVNYLKEQQTVHDIEHNREIASALLSELRTVLDNKEHDVSQAMSKIIDGYSIFGFRILVIDNVNQTIVVDSGSKISTPVAIKDSWLNKMTNLAGEHVGLIQENGVVRAQGKNHHPMLLLLQDVGNSGDNRWILGIAKDQKALNEFLVDLHWHLDAVLLLTYVLITLFGYYTMRSIGRNYEKRLETQVKERTKQLENAHEDLLHKTRLATIGQTATVLTHEMRNPLASIKLALSGIKDSESLQKRESRRVDLVLGEVDRLDALLSETLDYVKPVKLSAQPVELDLLLTRVLEQQSPLLQDKNIHVKRQFCNDGSALRIDEAQVHQVFLNMIKNAIEASPQGGDISISLQRRNNKLVLTMSNSGEILSKETLHRAFDPFYTTKPKGTGLGLGLVKRVVEEHGGSVVLESTSEFGTVLTLSFLMD
ncbi:MAG: ATP-binding protein [Gammaproteobacteria bacterium]|nr:ATP-binding protein [Gammaproteobacteria bacterium]